MAFPICGLSLNARGPWCTGGATFLDASPAVHRFFKALLEQLQLQRVWMAMLEQRFLLEQRLLDGMLAPCGGR